MNAYNEMNKKYFELIEKQEKQDDQTLEHLQTQINTKRTLDSEFISCMYNYYLI